MRDLRQRVNYNLQLVTAETTGAGHHRRQQYPAGDGLHAAKSPADAGKLARLLAERRPDHRGLAGAQQYQQRRIRQCRDYADQIAVLNQAGLTGEAQNLISNPQLQASSTPTQLASIRNGYVINEADRLREQGNTLRRMTS